MKTYILGAGSSCEFGYPLGKDIFTKAKEMAYSEVQSYKREEAKHLLRAYESVKNNLSGLITDLPDCPKLWPNFEEIYTFIDRELSISTGPRVSGASKNLKNDLKTMLFHTISECGFKAFLDDTALFDSYVECIRNIVEGEQVNIISFNYDILLPNALKSLGITPNYGYTCYDYDSKEVIRHLNFGESVVNIALPHGAINLADCSNCNKRYFSKDPITARIDNKRAPCPECAGSLNDNFLIIPSYIKDLEKDIDAKRILDFITQAEEIFIVGYSFPSYDYYARILFMIGLSRNCNNPTINIIDYLDPEEKEDKQKQDMTKEKYCFIDFNKYPVNISFDGFSGFFL